MNRIEIDSGHWVERYLAGGLSEAEARGFEAYWIEHPEILRDLEQGAQMMSGLAGLRANGQLGSLLRTSWWSGRMRLLVLAASLAVLTIGVSLWNGARGDAGALLAAAPASLPGLKGSVLPRGSVHTLMRLRSAASVDAVVTLPESPRALEVRVLPELALDAPLVDGDKVRPQPYALTLVRADAAGADHAVSRAGPLFAAADGFVTVFVDSRTLPPARYRLRLDPVGAAEAGPGFVIDVRSGTATP